MDFRFSPLAGIYLAESQIEEMVDARIGGFSPLAGIYLAERNNRFSLLVQSLSCFSPLAGIYLAERSDCIGSCDRNPGFQSPCGDLFSGKSRRNGLSLVP